jgi:hypothetical protein
VLVLHEAVERMQIRRPDPMVSQPLGEHRPVTGRGST